MLVALISAIIFLAILSGLLIFKIHMMKRGDIVGTIYISHEEDDVPLYFLSEIPIEELEKYPTGMIAIHSSGKGDK